MRIVLDIPEDLTRRLGSVAEATQLSREALGLEALRRGLWTEPDLGRFLGLGRLALDRFLKDRGVELTYTWEDLEQERCAHRELGRS
jgi:hypothetical protein